MFKIGIVGVGFVGTAVSTGLDNVLVSNPAAEYDIREYDKFKDTESIDSVVENSNIIFVCLPTPMNEDGSCNTEIVESGVEDVVKAAAEKRKIIVIKSTVPPGTTLALQKRFPNHTLVFNPEFLTEKNFIEDFINQDRVILGVAPGNENKIQKLLDLYKEFTQWQPIKPARIALVDCSVAEMLKYVSNTFLATKVAYFNEIYDICNAVKIPYDAVIKLLDLDERIGKTHLKVPGPDGKRGFGGSCFPKDMNALIAFAREETEIDPMVMDAAWTKNLMVREEYDWEKLAQVTGEYKKDG